ncbi:uncharacterized protein [Castor canadensis]|uniref:Uncharacterized protein n=1 Tax=Castor canadensis TaxID=51338 RepID=A0AC58KWZ3_CASCN
MGWGKGEPRGEAGPEGAEPARRGGAARRSWAGRARHARCPQPGSAAACNDRGAARGHLWPRLTAVTAACGAARAAEEVSASVPRLFPPWCPGLGGGAGLRLPEPGRAGPSRTERRRRQRAQTRDPPRGSRLRCAFPASAVRPRFPRQPEASRPPPLPVREPGSPVLCSPRAARARARGWCTAELGGRAPRDRPLVAWLPGPAQPSPAARACDQVRGYGPAGLGTVASWPRASLLSHRRVFGAPRPRVEPDCSRDGGALAGGSDAAPKAGCHM